MEKEFNLKEEKIDIVKRWVKSGEVNITKESYTRNITIELPVQVEDLVVEKIIDGNHETLRIPLSEEYYEHVKNTRVLNDIEIYKRCYNDIKHISVDIKKEELNIQEHRY